MVNRVPPEDITKTADGDHGFSLAVGDSLRINEGIDIVATGNGAFGINALGSNILSIAGSVSSSLSTGVALASNDLSMDVEGTGIVSGGRFGVLMSGARGVLTNYGNINGIEAGVSVGLTGVGIQIFNHGSIEATLMGINISSDANIVNSGTIEGALTGINAAGTPFHVVSFVNTGRISSASGVAIDLDNSRKINLVNTGVIDGHVRLSDNQISDDFYDGRGGTVTGTVFLNAGNDRAYGGAGNETIEGGGGNDTIDGGGGNDTAVYSGARANYTIVKNANGSLTVTDTRAGQDGVDTLTNVRFAKFSDQPQVVLHNTAPTGVALSKTAIAEDTLVNTVVMSLSATDADGDAVTYSLFSDVGGTFRIDGNSLVLVKALDYETQFLQPISVKAQDAYGGETIQSFLLDVTNVVETTGLTLTGTPGADSRTGEAGSDLIYGLAGNDVLKGEAGNDKLYGGLGKDVLTGGLGQDVFVFDSKPNKATNLDKIIDFNVRDDTIHLAKAAFSKIAKKGVLSSKAFYKGAKAHDADDRIIYDSKTGALFYDQDGKGAKVAIQMATLSKNLKMAAQDFYVI
jgi:Ca2+-binding RTX toxin-like protein